MALTISIEGKGLIANCDALSDTAGGTWSEQGGGTISVSTDVYFIRSASIGGKYAGKSGFHQYDIGAGNELDFTAGTGTEDGQLLYVWVAMTAPGTLDTLSTYPFCIRLSSDSPGTTNYIDYLVNSSDDNNGWNGSWKCFVIDPTKTPSRVSGTQSTIIASVRTMGIWIDCSGSARADSIFVNEMSVGSGLRITGTSTTGWLDTVNYCTDYSLRGWGMFQEREGVSYAYGKTYIGDAVNQAAAVSFTDSGRTIQFGFSEYCTNAATGTWASSMDVTQSGIVIEDHTSFATTFEDGVIVGTDNGRSGSSFLGTANMDVSIDLYGGNNAGSLTKLYATTFKGMTGGITWGNDADHLFFGGSISESDQFDPVGAVQLRNLGISGYTGTAAALLWNSNIDIADCAFIANTGGVTSHGVEHDTAGTFAYSNLTFSGNEKDVLFSAATGDLTITGTDGSLTSTNNSTGTITFPTSVTLTMTVTDEAGLPINIANAYIDDNNLTPFILNTTTNASGVATVDHTGGAVVGSTWRVRKYGYKPYKAVIDIGGIDISIPVTLIADPQQT